MERLLHYVWKYRLYAEASLVTTEGIPLLVLDPGLQNQNAGPDFFNAKIKIGDTLWAGNVEIHEKASDWFAHHHDTDKAYDSTILHVVENSDTVVHRMNGELIPQLILQVPEAVCDNMKWLLERDTSVACLSCMGKIEQVHISAWMDALLTERLERKTNDIERLLTQYKDDWNEVFYILLTRSFGFGINSDAFEWLAKSLPLKYIRKQRSSSSQIEAMLFGQAGMLSEELSCPYYRLLQREYAFFRHKYDLKPLDAMLFKNLRTRPSNFPHLKLAQLAAIWCRYDTLFSMILSATSSGMIKSYFRILPSEYWKTHYQFNSKSPEKEKRFGESALNILLINTVVPLLFAYGKRKKLPEYCQRAITLLESIPPEHNHIVSMFVRAGIPVYNASDTQALIQLKREYCEKRKCLYCRIGFRLLKRSVE